MVTSTSHGQTKDRIGIGRAAYSKIASLGHKWLIRVLIDLFLWRLHDKKDICNYFHPSVHAFPQVDITNRTNTNKWAYISI